LFTLQLDWTEEWGALLMDQINSKLIIDAMVLEANATPIILAALNNLKAEDWELHQNALNSMTILIQYGWSLLSVMRQAFILPFQNQFKPG
jgi:hypothetical protein